MTSHPKTLLRLNELTRSVHFTKAPRDLPPSGQSKGKEEGGMNAREAQKLANKIRQDKAKLKRQINSGEVSVVKVITTTDLPFTASEIIRSVRGFGIYRARQICSEVGIPTDRRIAAPRAGKPVLTELQRKRLAVAVGQAIEGRDRRREVWAKYREAA